MQNDYQILYEVLKDRTKQLEKLWKSTLVQFKAKNNSNSFEVAAQNNEIGRASFGRRINPTLLNSEPVRMETSKNPFLSASMVDVGQDSKEFLLNRPVGKHLIDSVWKKVPTTPVAKVGEGYPASSNSAKMEYAVYLKQGIIDRQQDLLKKLAEAYYQIVFDEATVEFNSFTESFGVILKILSIGNELFSLNSFAKFVVDNFLLQSFSKTSTANIFENSVELFLFVTYWVQISRDKIVKLLPDSLKCFEKNLLLDVVDPSLAQFFRNNFRKEESTSNNSHTLSGSGSGTGLSLQSLLPVAYSNQRDSKNFLRDPTSHANQQKIRDLFMNLIRHFSTNQLDTSHPNFHRGFGSRVSELMVKVNSENFAWLAHLYIQEYEQAADVRLDRFEERMASRRSTTGNSSSTTFSLDQIFFIFLQYADSFRLTKAIEKKIIAMISISLEQANNPHKRAMWSECIRKLRSIIKLLAFCRYKMFDNSCAGNEQNDLISVEEEDVIIYSWTQDAILNRQLLTLLPLIYEYFTFIGPDAIKSRCSNTVKLLLRYYQVKFEARRKRLSRARLILRLSLEDLFRETLKPEFYSECAMSMNVVDYSGGEEEEEVDDEKRISEHKSKENGVLARSIDEDDQLPPFVSSVYRSISTQIRGIYNQINSLCMNLNLSTAEKSHHFESSNNSAQLDSTPRKVRPVTQVPAADLKQQKIQKQLRQWFWWRYGSQKDLVDSLNAYILEQVLFPQFPFSASSDRTKNSELCKQMYRELICKILPDLLPNFWKDQPELVEMIINLSLELASKAIKHHFS